MMVDYEERIKELFGELKPASYYVSEENLATDRQLTKTETYNIFLSRERTYKRRVFVHMNSYYLPNFIRGMTDTIRHIWINAKEYSKKLVFRHEKIHFKFPWMSEETVRELDDFYDPDIPDVEFVYD